MIVIGIDGMDPRLCERMMAEGLLAEPREAAGGRRIQHAGHEHSAAEPGCLGQLHQRGRAGRPRDLRLHPPASAGPVRSVLLGRRDDPRRRILGRRRPRLQLDFWPFNHKLPRTVLRRQGVPFWDYLDQAGVPSTFYDLPSNYPASPSHHGHHRCMSGMGTPDMLGTYGTYQHFAEDGPAEPSDEAGGKRSAADLRGRRGQGADRRAREQPAQDSAGRRPSSFWSIATARPTRP